MNPHLDYYAILGIEQRATPDEIKRAFREKARQFHPDVNDNADATERFKEINEAYRVLGDRRQRETYDARRVMLYGWGSGGLRGDRDRGVEEILKRWRTQPPPPRQQPPTSPFARRSRRGRFRREVSVWLMTSSLICLLLGTFWALTYQAPEPEPAPTVRVVLPTAGPVLDPTPDGPRPRRIDVWTIFDSGRLNYATLIYPEAPGVEGEPVELRLPLQDADWEILIYNGVYGARRVEVGGSADFDGGLLWVIPDPPARDAGPFPEAYGADLQLVTVSLLAEVEGRTQVDIPLDAGGSFAEWVVAVAVPALSGGGASEASAVRDITNSDWRIIYFDLTQAPTPDTLHMIFDMAAAPGVEPDPFLVDSLRP